MWLVSGLAVGCGCPRFSEMVVTNPEGVAVASDLYEFSRAIAHFEQWTGWNGVCVPELSVRSELRDGRIVGLYQGPHQPILLATGAGHSTAVHEMCHAADQRLGWISDDFPEQYPVTHIDPVTYSTRASQVHESFARACEAGPDGLALVRGLEQACGIPLEHPGYELVLDRVYEAANPVRKPARLRTLEQEDVGIDALIGAGELWDIASGAELIWLVVRDPDPLLERDDPTDHLTRHLWRLVGWSPQTRRVEVSRTLLRRPPGVLEANRTFSLLDSVDEPVLVEGTAYPPMHLWRIDEQTGELTRLDDQPFTTGASPMPLGLGGVVQNGVAAIRVDNPPQEEPMLASPASEEGRPTSFVGKGWVAVELESGRIMDDHHGLQGALGPGLQGSGTTLTATADGTVAVGVEPVVIPYWPYQAHLVAHDGSRTHLQVAAAGLSNPIAMDPEGRLLSIWSNSDVWHAIDTRRFLVLHDPGSGDYWVPGDACVPGDGGMAIDRVMHVNGALWVYGTVLGSNRQILRRLSAGDGFIAAKDPTP